MGIFKRLFSAAPERETHPYCAAIVAAGGSSQRMQGENKLFAPLGDTVVLGLALQALETCPLIDEIVLVIRGADIVRGADLCAELGLTKVTKILAGGDTRSASVQIGLGEISSRAKLVAIHDGARPLVSQAVLETVIRAAAASGAAAPGVPVKDTIKVVAEGLVQETPDRKHLLAVQTPQVFDADLYKAALQKALLEGAELTDDCMAVERLGMPVRMTPGDYANIKITTPEDLATAALIYSRRDGYCE